MYLFGYVIWTFKLQPKRSVGCPCLAGKLMVEKDGKQYAYETITLKNIHMINIPPHTAPIPSTRFYVWININDFKNSIIIFRRFYHFLNFVWKVMGSSLRVRDTNNCLCPKARDKLNTVYYSTSIYQKTKMFAWENCETELIEVIYIRPV